MFDQDGRLDRDAAERIFRAHQLALAREAVELVWHDVRATIELEPPPFEYRDEDGSIRLAFRGQYCDGTGLRSESGAGHDRGGGLCAGRGDGGPARCLAAVPRPPGGFTSIAFG